MDSGSPLPGIETTDSNDTRWALETARTLWGQGERREALQWVRRAAEAAAESGGDDRALALAKLGAELRTELEIPRTLPPPPPAAPVVVPAIPRAVVPVVPQVAAPQVAVPPAAVAPPAAAPPAAVPPAESAATAAMAARIAEVPAAKERGDSELVVTVVSTDGSVPAPDASIVSHRAVRVAVTAVASDASELRVRRLADGEVAPKDSTVALLVAFEPGGSPLPRPPAT